MNSANPLQTTISPDTAHARDSDFYKAQYVHSLVEKWDQLINWDARAASEGVFFINELRRRGAHKILDVATGTGFHSISLIKAGFEVVSADGSPEMLARAFANGRKHSQVLRTVQADWRWLNRDVHGKFDAVICLGNSFTHLFSERDRRKALAEFYAALRHDGILIIDQRNYDAILDSGFKFKHTYYYCGKNVRAEPEHVDEGLARFRYEFPDQSVFHLNMYPLRKDYVRTLLNEVGFQTITTLGDFHETYQQSEPDFYIHIAEKRYDNEPEKIAVRVPNDPSPYSEPVNTARDYYNDDSADLFYHSIWGGEDIHIGLYDYADEDITSASRRTIERLAAEIPRWSPELRVIDIGSGYGGCARYLASTHGCQVTCLNLSEVQNQRNRRRNEETRLDRLIRVVDGSFEAIPFPDRSFDVVWSQDAILHSGDRERVCLEVDRMLKPGGHFVFTDPMQTDGAPQEALEPVLDRLQIDSMASLGFYRDQAKKLGWEEVRWTDCSEHLILHYSRVREELVRNEGTQLRRCRPEYVERMKAGLQNWINAGDKGHLTWGILLFRKKA